VTAADRYATPSAFRRALTDRLKTVAGTRHWTLPQLQRHVAYDRLLERLYLFDRDWVVKGAAALMARELGTRGTLDIDLYREISLAAAEADLRHASTADIGDWFRFEVGAATPVGTVGARLPVTSVIGTTTWASVHVDLIGSGLRMTGQPEHVPPLAENASIIRRAGPAPMGIRLRRRGPPLAPGCRPHPERGPDYRQAVHRPSTGSDRDRPLGSMFTPMARNVN
jgi:hypothetical protein